MTVIARALLSTAVILALSACTDSESARGGPVVFYTHCGVDQVKYEGTIYHATAVFDGPRDVSAPPNDSYGGPTPWLFDSAGEQPTGDGNVTYGDIIIESDGTAVVTVRGGRYSIRLSEDSADARWNVHGCY